MVDDIIRSAGAVPPVDRTQRTLTDGSPVTANDRDLKPNGLLFGVQICPPRIASGSNVTRDVYELPQTGAVRIRVRGTVDRRALCEVLAAVGTVGR